ncbi:MAG: 50S ribosomal protein L29 [Myxococcales bacterium]|nr:50S ribosomal protein L29 [Myxococcales bacterium]
MSDVAEANALRERTDEELQSFIKEKQHELFRLRFQHFTGQLENTAKMKAVRREVARAKTLWAERHPSQRARLRAGGGEQGAES